jgi:TP901 family phage tail tape measure protein
MAENIEFRLKIIEDKLGAVLDQNEQKAKKLQTQLKSVVGILEQVGNESQKIKEAFLGNLGASVVQKSLAAVSAGFGKVIADSREFSRAVAEINSVLPQGTKLTREQEQALAKLSERFGTSAAAQAKGFFEAVSNGIEDTAKAGEILTAANNAALSGLVDLNTAARLITATLNAYSTQGTTAAQVTDSLVAVTQLSGIKFEELAQTVGRVTNVAAQSGVSIGELGGTLAFLNQRSLTTEQAVTGIAGILAEVSKPSTEAAAAARSLGIEFNVAALKAKGLVPFLQDITDKTGGNVTNLRQLFGDQRAANAIVAIASGEFSKYADVVDRVTKSSGEASRAATSIKESLDFKLDALSASFNALTLSVGNKFSFAVDSATGLVKLFKLAIDGTPKSLDETRNRLSALGIEYNNLKDRIAEYNKTGAGSTSEAKVALEKRLNEILKERQDIRSGKIAENDAAIAAATAEAEKKRAIDAVSTDLVITNSRIESYNQMAIAKTSLDALFAERELTAKAEALIASEEDYNQFLLAEQKKIDAKFAFEEQKAALISDSVTKQQTQQAIANKKELDLEQARVSKMGILLQSESREKQRQLQIQGNYIQTAANLAGAFAKEGSIASFLIQKGAAVAGVAVQDAQARTAAMTSAQIAAIGLPLGARESYIAAAYAKSSALITSNTALAASAIAASAIKGFEGGGVIGATSGPDNMIAAVRTGEMVLNADQQGKLFSAINSGGLGGGDVVINIDGREIIRVINNQIKSGARIAS